MPYAPTVKQAKKQAILYALERGTSRKNAARLAQIHFSTMLEWRQEDPTFSDQIMRAEAEAQRHYEEVIRQATEGYDVVKTVVRETKDGTFTTTETERKWNPELALPWLRSHVKDEWTEPTIHAIARALSDEQIREILGAGTQQDPWELAERETRALETATETPAGEGEGQPE